MSVTEETNAARAHSGPGRPRAYDEAEVLEKALQIFWKQGYEATSVDDLTGAMSLSRSSFYSAFGSKQGVLLAVLKHYSSNALTALRDLSHGPADQAVETMMAALSGASEGPKGCMLVNCITELAPHQPEVAELGRAHLEQIEGLFAKVINPQDPASACAKAAALSALAIGVLTLRKSGVAPDRIDTALQSAKAIISS